MKLMRLIWLLKLNITEFHFQLNKICNAMLKYVLALWLSPSLPPYSSNSIDLSTCSRSEKHNANSCTNVGNKIYYNSTYAFCYQWGVTFHIFTPCRWFWNNYLMFYQISSQHLIWNFDCIDYTQNSPQSEFIKKESKITLGL